MNKIYHSLHEVEKEFFPALIKKREEEELEKLRYTNPKEWAKRISKQMLENILSNKEE